MQDNVYSDELNTISPGGNKIRRNCNFINFSRSGYDIRCGENTGISNYSGSRGSKLKFIADLKPQIISGAVQSHLRIDQVKQNRTQHNRRTGVRICQADF